ncbi:MAG: hypothetical protein IIW48_05695 [Clostridia bacterium]|nr:hypothetical protein [Clostridia bacterium]
MGMSFKDKLNIMKVLSSEEGREKFKEMFELKLRSQNAREATAKCISAALDGVTGITELKLSAGEADFLPLCVTVTADGETKRIEAAQPADADFDYADICAQFNALVSENEAEKNEFLQKTAAMLEGIINENAAASENFAVQIC